MRYFIRKMEERDVETVAQIEADNFSQPWSAEAFRALLQNPDAFYYVAEERGEVAGCCGVRNLIGEGEITNVAVKETFRGRGVAEAMLTALMEEGKKAGISAYTLEVRAGNVAAVRLYEKLGFVTEGVRRDFYEKPKEDALIMWKR